MREVIIVGGMNFKIFDKKICAKCKHDKNKCAIYLDIFYYGVSEHVTAETSDKYPIDIMCDEFELKDII